MRTALATLVAVAACGGGGGLWDGEWEDMPAARPARDAVDHIIRRIKGS